MNASPANMPQSNRPQSTRRLRPACAADIGRASQSVSPRLALRARTMTGQPGRSAATANSDPFSRPARPGRTQAGFARTAGPARDVSARARRRAGRNGFASEAS